MTGLEGIALGCAGVAISAVVFGLFGRRGYNGSPHKDIPSRREIPKLMALIVARPEVRELLAKRHHRGAIYWYAIDQGQSVRDALELAMDPQASSVKYEVIYG